MTTEAAGAIGVAAAPTQDEAAAAIVPKRIYIVDDELAGLSYSHLPEVVTQLFDDRTSPEFAELWRLVMGVKGYPDLATAEVDMVRTYVSSDALVREVILSDHFKTNASAQLTGPLTGFLEVAENVQNLRKHFEDAFPSPEYELIIKGARPSNSAELMQYHLVVLDLVLKKSASAVDEVIDYLKMLGENTYPAALPCIIVMSSQPELLQERLQFSNGSNISAAGLLVLPKAEVIKTEFGAPGLTLSYQQLDRQRDVAQKMRIFMREWMAALEAARLKASIALWNLDAAAMQEIHLEVYNDNDAYDEHLNELIGREYLWHVESVPEVGMAIENLDACFQAQFKANSKPAVIENRFIAPFVRPKNGRDLISHFTWTGFTVPEALPDVEDDEALKKFNKLVPFGAFLAPENLAEKSECLIHITQQCDLNRPKPGQAAFFVVVEATEILDNKIPPYTTEDLVARGLMFAGKEYDFKFEKGRQLALTIPEFIKYAKAAGLRVVSRLRHDIATNFLLATANQMTRPASRKVKHVQVTDVNLYLYGDKFPNGKLVQLLDADTGKALTAQVAINEKKYYFQDDVSIRIALWIQRELKTQYGISDVDVATVCNKLSVGLTKGECLVKIVHFKFEGIKRASVTATLAGHNFPSDKVQLVAIFEP